MFFANLPIVYQTSDLLVVDKPSGLSVHNNEDAQNLINVLLDQLGVESLYPVHRLDRETSGLQIFSLNSRSAQKLSLEFEKRTVKKAYTGILRGKLKLNQGVWTQKLTDRAEGRKNPAGISKNRIFCETKYQVLKTSPYFTMCEFDLITGRQHQIRKHTAIAKHALIGDPRYGDSKYNKKITHLYKTERMFLHCSKIDILGMEFESPVSDEFEVLFEELKDSKVKK